EQVGVYAPGRPSATTVRPLNTSSVVTSFRWSSTRVLKVTLGTRFPSRLVALGNMANPFVVRPLGSNSIFRRDANRGPGLEGSGASPIRSRRPGEVEEWRDHGVDQIADLGPPAGVDALVLVEDSDRLQFAPE